MKHPDSTVLAVSIDRLQDIFNSRTQHPHSMIKRLLRAEGILAGDTDSYKTTFVVNLNYEIIMRVELVEK